MSTVFVFRAAKETKYAYILKSNRIEKLRNVRSTQTARAKPVPCSSRWKLLLAVKLIGAILLQRCRKDINYTRKWHEAERSGEFQAIFSCDIVRTAPESLKSFRVRGISNFYQLSGIDFLSRGGREKQRKRQRESWFACNYNRGITVARRGRLAVACKT